MTTNRRRKVHYGGTWKSIHNDGTYHARTLIDNHDLPPGYEPVTHLVVTTECRPLLLTMPLEDVPAFIAFLQEAMEVCDGSGGG